MFERDVPSETASDPSPLRELVAVVAYDGYEVAVASEPWQDGGWVPIREPLLAPPRKHHHPAGSTTPMSETVVSHGF